MAENTINIIINATNNASRALGDTATGLGKIGAAAPSASKCLGDIGGGLQRIAEYAVGNLLSVGIQKIGSSLASAAQEALGAYANFERLGSSLEALVAREMVNASGGAASMTDAMKQAAPAAKELLGWTQKLAIESPLRQEGVANAFKTALAYGFTSQEAQKLTQQMIDFTSATGKSEDTLGLVAYALGQIRTSDKLMTQDLRQLMNAGVDVNGILAKMGYKLSDVGKVSVSSGSFLTEFSRVMERDFGGAAKRQANTFSGLLSSIGDLKEVGLRELFTGTFQAVQPLLANLVNIASSGAFTSFVRDIGEGLGGALRTVTQPLASVVGLFGKLMQLREGARGSGVRGREARGELMGFDLQAELQKAVPFLSKDQSGALVAAAQGNLGPVFDELGKVAASAWNEKVVPMLQGLGSQLAALIFGSKETGTAGFGATGEQVGGWMQGAIEGLQTWLLENQDQLHAVTQAIVGGITSTALNLVEFAGRILASLYQALVDPENNRRAVELGSVIGSAIADGIAEAVRAKVTGFMPEGAPGTAGQVESPWTGLWKNLVAPNAPQGAVYAGGRQRGGSFTVPSGYSNDRFMIGLSSGERVDVTPAGATYDNRQNNTYNLNVQDTLAAAYIMEQARRGRMSRLAGAM